MNSLPDNVLPLLLDGRSTLKSSFKGFSDDQLRLGLMQMVDGLERMDELSGFLDAASESWRQDKPNSEDEWKKIEASFVSTPLAASTNALAPWSGYQVADLQNKQCTIENLPRADLEAALRMQWEGLKRFHAVATLLSRDASRIMAGEWIQDESNKPEPEIAPKPTRRLGR